jgi:hypothetical protein
MPTGLGMERGREGEKEREGGGRERAGREDDNVLGTP